MNNKRSVGELGGAPASMMKESDLNSSKFKTAGAQGQAPEAENFQEEIEDEVDDLMNI